VCGMSTFSTGKPAAYLGVGVKTLQRWDREGRLKPERTPSGRHAYSKALLGLCAAIDRRRPESQSRIAGCQARRKGRI
jgi:putative resolvase